MTLDPTTLAIAADLLDLAASEFANHGCNDYELLNTPSNLAFVKQMIAASDEPDDTPYLMRGGAWIGLQDNSVMRYCAKVLREAAQVPETSEVEPAPI